MRGRARSGESSLVLFTVLTQAAVGLSLVSEGFRWAAPGPVGIAGTTGPALVLVLLLLGALCAVAHLGRAGAARFALANLRSSWLSREMLFGLSFGAMVASQLGLYGLDAGSPVIRGILGVGAPLVGLALVHAICRIYMIRTVPAWNAWTTPAAFFGTVLLLGAALFTAAATVTANTVDRAFASLCIAVTVLTVLQVAVTNLHYHRFVPRGGPGGTRNRFVLGMRIVLAGLGAAILLALAWHGARELRVAGSLSLACVMLLLGELLGRHLFYASHRRVGL